MPRSPAPTGSLPDPEQLRDALEAEAQAKTKGALAEAPALLRLTLTLPYARGYPLSLAEGTELLDDPPATTEQVMHAERRRADFEVADLAPLEAALPPGCESLGQNTLGELGIWVLLQDLGGAAVSAAASDGWDGDRYLAARCGERLAFVWWTAWDSERTRSSSPMPMRGSRRRCRPGPASPRRRARFATARACSIASDPLAPLLPLLGERARRARIHTLDSLRAHFGLAPAQP